MPLQARCQQSINSLNRMDKINRIWNENDFSELYEEQPKVVNTSTYHVVHLVVKSETIKVKIPTNSTQEVYKFLLYKAIYFHHLDSKTSSPLCKTAAVSFFESPNGFQEWYGLWSGGRSLSKNCPLYCVDYQHEESISKYKPLAVLQGATTKILSRSRRDGKYYNISIKDNKAEDESTLKQLQESSKCLQHPFLAQPVEYHRNSKFTYFIFQHHPSLLAPLVRSQPITKQQKHVYFIELLLAMIFLDHQPTLHWTIDMEMLFVNFDGHLIIGEDVIMSETKKDNKYLFLKQFYCFLMDKQNFQQFSPQELGFRDFLMDLCLSRKSALKQVLAHPWVQGQNVQKILTKSNNCFASVPTKPTALPDLEQISKQEIDKYFESTSQEHPASCKFESFKMSCQTPNEIVLKRYWAFDQPQRLQKTSSTLSLGKKSGHPRVQIKCEVMTHMNSPYRAVLRKQTHFIRRRHERQE